MEISKSKLKQRIKLKDFFNGNVNLFVFSFCVANIFFFERKCEIMQWSGNFFMMNVSADNREKSEQLQ